MRVLVIADTHGVSEFYRAATPYRLLHQAGLIEADFDSGNNPAVVDHLHRYDAVVFSRPDSPEHLLLLTEAKMAGLRTVVDVDDNLILLPPSIAAYGAWHQRGTGKITPRLWLFKRAVRQADVLTVSTEALGAQLCDGQPHRLRGEGDYRVLPNQILASDWSGLQAAQKDPGETWVGWWGIYNHWDDWRDIAPYIEPVIAARPRVKLVILGMPELAHLFPRLRKMDQLIIGPFVAPEEMGEYRRLVAQFDIGLAPTTDIPFNRAKSDLKMLQYGAAGVPVIASQATYGQWRSFATILNSPDGWGGALEYLLDHPEVARRDGQRLQQAVLAGRTYEGNYTRWLEPLGLEPAEVGISEVMAEAA